MTSQSRDQMAASAQAAGPFPPLPLEARSAKTDPFANLATLPWRDQLTAMTVQELYDGWQLAWNVNGGETMIFYAEEWNRRVAEGLADDVDPLLAAELDHLANCQAQITVDQHRALTEQIADRFEALGAPARAAAVRQRQAMLDGDPLLVNELAAVIEASGDRSAIISSLLRQLNAGEDGEEVMAKVRELLGDVDPAEMSLGDRLHYIDILLSERGWTAEELLEKSDEAARVLGTDDAAPGWMDIWRMRVIAHSAMEETEEAKAAAREAWEVAERSGSVVNLLNAASLRRIAGVNSVDDEEIEEWLLQELAVAQDFNRGDAEFLSRWRLAMFYSEQDRPLDVMLVGEPVLEPTELAAKGWPEEPEKLAKRGELAGAMARAAKALGEDDRVEPLLRQSIDDFAKAGDDSQRADSLQALAEVLEDKQPTEAVQLYQQAADLFGAVGEPVARLHALDCMLWPLAKADGPDVTMQHAYEIHLAAEQVASAEYEDEATAEFVRTWDFDHFHARIESTAARILSNAGRQDEALERVAWLDQHCRQMGDDQALATTHLLEAQILLSTGNSAKGERALGVLDAVLTEAARNGWDGMQRHAAGLGARWLNQTDRPAEAEAFWQRGQQ